MGGGGLLFPLPLRLRGEEKIDSSGLWRLSPEYVGKKSKFLQENIIWQELIQGGNATLLKLLATSFSLEKGASTRLMPCH